MYRAELHGKLSRENENKEDILTSNVFSFFLYTDREVFLYPFLRDILKLDVTNKDTLEAEFNFWPRYDDKTEPDLVILVGRYYLLFEAKYFSGFGQESQHTKSQLIREIQGGILDAHNLQKEFVLVAITAHYTYKTEIFKDIPRESGLHFKWVNWQSVANLLQDVLENQANLSRGTRLFAEDLYQLLLRKNLKNYEGPVHLYRFSRILPSPVQLFFAAQTAMFRGAFIGFLSALSTAPVIEPSPQIFFFNSQSLFLASLTTLKPDVKPTKDWIFYNEQNRTG